MQLVVPQRLRLVGYFVQRIRAHPVHDTPSPILRYKSATLDLRTLAFFGINARKNNNQTPLHTACQADHKNMVELLIAKGTDVNVRNKMNQTPLSLAKRQGYTEIAELLHKRSAKE